jgi:hypothetical protein
MTSKSDRPVWSKISNLDYHAGRVRRLAGAEREQISIALRQLFETA